MSQSLSQLLAEVANLSKAQFAAKYGHPWLVCEAQRMPVRTSGSFEIVSPVTAMAPPTKKPTVEQLDVTILRSQPDAFLVLPILKTDRNPWSERVIIGRAKNNDLVLNNQSVSKVHAFFSKSGTKYHLSALETLNPTTRNTTPLTAAAGAVEIADGDDLQFGTVRCRYFESESLYDVLTGRV